MWGHECSEVEQQPEHASVNFISKVTAPCRQAVLAMPQKKNLQQVIGIAEDGNTIRRSGRLVMKHKIKGNKNTKQLAQEVLIKKLGDLGDNADPVDDARKRIIKLFDCPISKEVMQAMEHLLQAMNFDIRKSTKHVAKVAADGGK